MRSTGRAGERNLGLQYALTRPCDERGRALPHPLLKSEPLTAYLRPDGTLPAGPSAYTFLHEATEPLEAAEEFTMSANHSTVAAVKSSAAAKLPKSEAALAAAKKHGVDPEKTLVTEPRSPAAKKAAKKEVRPIIVPGKGLAIGVALPKKAASPKPAGAPKKKSYEEGDVLAFLKPALKANPEATCTELLAGWRKKGFGISNRNFLKLWHSVRDPKLAAAKKGAKK